MSLDNVVQPGPRFAVAIDRTPGGVTVSVIGEIDIDSAARLEDTLSDLLERGDARITLHLAGVSFVDSVGVSVLVTAAERAERAGGRLQLREPSSAVRKMLEARGLETRFPVV